MGLLLIKVITKCNALYLDKPLLIFSMICLTCSCGSYSDRTKASRIALLQGRTQQALESLDTELNESSNEGNDVLLHLERGLARQQFGDYRGSSEDFMLADERLEVIDYTSTPIKELGTYLYSDDSAPYKAMSVEKAFVNVLNLVNFLLLKEWSKAKVEARRLGVLESYWGENLSDELKVELAGLRRFVYWLTTFTYLVNEGEASAQKEAERGGISFPFPPSRAQGEKFSPVLIVSGAGMVPHKMAQRLPLGRALLYVGPSPHWTAEERSSLARIQAKGLVKWVNFTTLSPEVPALEEHIQTGQMISKATAELGLSQLIRAHFQRAQPLLMTAAISRLITRALVGGITESAAKAKSNGAVGLLVSLIAEGAMASADTPDTRSWSSLPSMLRLYWLWLPPGRHELNVSRGSRMWRESVLVHGQGEPYIFHVPLSLP